MFDAQQIDPVTGYYKQFPLGREPFCAPGNVTRLRVKGDGTQTCMCYIIFKMG
jgi:hypothetical protein